MEKFVKQLDLFVTIQNSAKIEGFSMFFYEKKIELRAKDSNLLSSKETLYLVQSSKYRWIFSIIDIIN